MENYEDDGTWIWLSFAPECRLIISHEIGERKQYMADKIITSTDKRIAKMPLFVSDGLKFYTNALLKIYGGLKYFFPTGKKGRPRIPKIVPDDDLRYAQVIKNREDGKLSDVKKKIIFGENIDLKDISTSLIERQNLTIRQDNNRVSRKTIGFSKTEKGLKNQTKLYFASYNFCRKHLSLKHKNQLNNWEYYTPAREYGLTNHNWTLRELLKFPYRHFINQ